MSIADFFSPGGFGRTPQHDHGDTTTMIFHTVLAERARQPPGSERHAVSLVMMLGA